MLGKLLKYEFKNISKMLLPIYLCIFGLSVLSGILFQVTSKYFLHSTGILTSILNAISAIALFACIFGIVAIVLGALFIILQRYYQNFFKDEGYLTFTLPVKTSTHIGVKLISGFIWMFLSVLVACICGLTLALFASADNSFINVEIFRGIGVFFRELSNIMNLKIALIGIEVLIAGIIYILFYISILYLAITFGAIIAKKHKILASFGFYYLFNMVSGIVLTVIILIIGGSLSVNIDMVNEYAITAEIFGAICALYGGGTVGVYCLNNYMLKHKLNLS